MSPAKKTAPLSGAPLKKVFAKTGALLEGHFLLSSGLHSGRYMQCALVLSRPKLAEELGQCLAASALVKPDVVLSPALGGIVIGQELAKALGARAYFAERENGVLTLRRGFAIKPGEIVAVAEDVVTTGKSTREVMDLARRAGATVREAFAVVDRGAEPGGSLGVPLHSLIHMNFETYAPEECPLCRAGKPAVKPGSRPEPEAERKAAG